MKPEQVYLNELKSSSKSYKVKVKVIEKGRPRTSPKKGVLYQNLLLEDDKGNRMKGALFGDQIEVYKDAIIYNGVYEVANAPIKKCDAQWKNSPDDLDYQMSFGGQTIIQPVETKALTPEYCPISKIPKLPDDTGKYDVLAVVLYVDAKPRHVITSQEREVLVREIMIVDQSSEQPVTISAWNDLAEKECDLLNSWSEQFTMAAFTALKVSNHKGFSLTTTMSTTIIVSPKCEQTNNLEQWVSRSGNMLSDMRQRIMDVRNSVNERAPTKISALRQKKAHNTLQEERHWLQVTVPHPDFEKINAYLGCSYCGKRAEVPPGIAFTCTTCSKKGCICSPRVTFSCEVSDGTGQLSITTFTEDSEKLFRMQAADIFRVKHSDDNKAFSTIQKMLQTNTFMIQVGPKATLTRNNVLQWVLKRIEGIGSKNSANDDLKNSSQNAETKLPETISVVTPLQKCLTPPKKTENQPIKSLPSETLLGIKSPSKEVAEGTREDENVGQSANN
ncbi:hypothetical protein vseg_007504 [Gypsophila vaccaria]